MFGSDWGDFAGCASDPNTPASLACIPAVFANIISALLTLAGVVAVFFIIIGGFKLINSGGDPKQLDSARKTLVYAVLGLALVFLSFLIVRTIAYVTGVDCIRLFGFNQCV